MTRIPRYTERLFHQDLSSEEIYGSDRKKEDGIRRKGFCVRQETDDRKADGFHRILRRKIGCRRKNIRKPQPVRFRDRKKARFIRRIRIRRPVCPQGQRQVPGTDGKRKAAA
jgi:hypothetical protein